MIDQIALLMINKVNKRHLPKLLLVACALFVLGFLVYSFFNDDTKVVGSSNSTEEIKLAKPLASMEVGRSFEYPIRDKDGNEVSNLKITVENISLDKEIVVKGKKSRAIEGRAFLILNLKIQNQFNKSIDINTRDYFRLSVNGNQEEKLAPEIHNDPISAQAISTKLTRVGFIVYESDSNLTLHVGEINGVKESFELGLKNK